MPDKLSVYLEIKQNSPYSDEKNIYMPDKIMLMTEIFEYAITRIHFDSNYKLYQFNNKLFLL